MPRSTISRTRAGSLSALTPGAGPAIVRVSACTRPCGDAGGDFYDLLPFDSDHLGVFIGDVSGHGPLVGPIADMTRELMRQQARRFGAGDPADMLSSLNQMLFEHLPAHIFVTAVFGILHRPSGAFRFVRAGHCRPLFCDDGVVGACSSNGIALGLDNGEIFRGSLETERWVFRNGSRLLLYTDGLTEALDRAEEEFGVEGLTASLKTHHEVAGEEAFLSAILRDWRKHLAGSDPQDDVTVIDLHHSE